MGDGRVSLGGLAGWQPRIGSHRYQLLGELGAERFSDVGGTLLSSPSARETWLDYAGVRLGVTETFGGDGPFELGAWVFVRKDLGQADVSSTSGNFLTRRGDHHVVSAGRLLGRRRAARRRPLRSEASVRRIDGAGRARTGGHVERRRPRARPWATRDARPGTRALRPTFRRRRPRGSPGRLAADPTRARRPPRHRPRSSLCSSGITR